MPRPRTWLKWNVYPFRLIEQRRPVAPFRHLIDREQIKAIRSQIVGQQIGMIRREKDTMQVRLFLTRGIRPISRETDYMRRLT